MVGWILLVTVCLSCFWFHWFGAFVRVVSLEWFLAVAFHGSVSLIIVGEGFVRLSGVSGLFFFCLDLF